MKKAVKELKVLIQDESPVCRKIHEKLWVKAGHSVSTIENGSQILETLKKSLLNANRGDGAVIDVVMLSVLSVKEGSGFQTACRLRMIGFKGYIVAVTATSSSDDIAKMMDNGANFVLQKPLKQEQLLGVIKGETHPCCNSLAMTSNLSFNSDIMAGKQRNNKMTLSKDIEGKGEEVTETVLKEETDAEAYSFRRMIFTDHLAMKTLRVLIVDDSASARKILNYIFHKKSHIVIQAETGEVAFSMVENSIVAQQFGVTFVTYDIVMLTEIMQDEVSGNLCKRLREVGYKGIILGMISHPHHTSVDRFIRNGANAVLPKPVRADRLWKCINGTCTFLLFSFFPIVFS